MWMVSGKEVGSIPLLPGGYVLANMKFHGHFLPYHLTLKKKSKF
jgi:hypothetical protein